MVTEPTYEAEVIEKQDARTGEMVVVSPQPPTANTLATTLDLTKVGTLVLDDKAEQVLAQPLDENDVRIRPDGLVYLPWTWYAKRLNDAFGRTSWGLVPQAGPKSMDIGNSTVLVVWGHWLVVRGVPIGFEMGEMSYRKDNNTMSYGDAAAGAKSNSLARNCKMLGMSLELWDADWVNDWRNRHAETYQKNNRTYWRKKGDKAEKVEKVESKPVKAEEKPVVDKSAYEAHANQASESDGAKAAVAAVATEPAAAVKAEDAAEKLYSVQALSKIEAVTNIASKTGKKTSEVGPFIAKLDKSQKYTISQIVEMLTKEG